MNLSTAPRRSNTVVTTLKNPLKFRDAVGVMPSATMNRQCQEHHADVAPPDFRFIPAADPLSTASTTAGEVFARGAVAAFSSWTRDERDCAIAVDANSRGR